MDARSCVRCIKGYSVRVLTGTDAQIVRPYNRYSSRSSGTDALPRDTLVRPYTGYTSDPSDGSDGSDSSDDL